MKTMSNGSSKLIKSLNGHSGCQVDLIEKDSRILVSKISANNDYNFRLRRQAKKQALFVPNHNVFAPKIVTQGYSDNLYYFDMEFVQGRTMAEYTNDIHITEITDFIRCLFKCLYWDNDKVSPKAQEIFMQKIYSLEVKLQEYRQLNLAFQILKDFNWQKVFKSFCHGDLTLENILITQDKRLYLIDFLDSFYNSWQIDIAKLLQDLELKWSFRNCEISSNRALRLQVAKEALVEEILKTNNGKEKLDTIYHILLLNIVRIYPYTKDVKTFKFLDNAVNMLVEKLVTKRMGVI